MRNAGIGLVAYRSLFGGTQIEREVRERDYFWVGAFVAFSIWVGIGAEAELAFARGGELALLAVEAGSAMHFARRFQQQVGQRRMQ